MEFKFVHLSDLHFSVVPSHINPLDHQDKTRLYKAAWIYEQKRQGKPWSLPTTFERDVAVVLAGDLKKRVLTNSLDGIIVTGDLATTGNDRDISVAKSFLTGTLGPEFVLPELASGFMNFYDTLPVIVLPGNHDRYTENFLGRSKSFEGNSAFTPSWDGGFNHINKVIADNNSDRLRYAIFERDSEKLIFIQADFSLERWGDASAFNGISGILGQGLAYRKVIKALKKLTARLQKDFSCESVVWLCHFPPEVEDDKICPRNMELLCGNRLSKAASESKVAYILAGHVHHHINYSPINGVEVICTASATDPVGTPSFNEFSFSVSSGKIADVSWLVRTYEHGAFV